MKFYGSIGFWNGDVEVKRGVYKSNIIERQYFGDVLENKRRFQQSSGDQNDDLRVTNKLSIVSDLYLQQNWSSIRYVKWNGVKWSVSDVDIETLPRIILALGGVYNGKTSNRT